MICYVVISDGGEMATYREDLTLIADAPRGADGIPMMIVPGYCHSVEDRFLTEDFPEQPTWPETLEPNWIRTESDDWGTWE